MSADYYVLTAKAMVYVSLELRVCDPTNPHPVAKIETVTAQLNPGETLYLRMMTEPHEWLKNPYAKLIGALSRGQTLTKVPVPYVLIDINQFLPADRFCVGMYEGEQATAVRNELEYLLTKNPPSRTPLHAWLT